MRTEDEIFESLCTLTASPGYAHALAYLCLRDNAIFLSGDLVETDVANLFSEERLQRTEQSTLIGLMLKQSPLDLTLPAPETLQGYIADTEELLKELHHSMMEVVVESVHSGDHDVFSQGKALREPIFYGGDSAYGFQYRDFSVDKFRNDNQWLRENRGFAIEEARQAVFAIQQQMEAQSPSVLREMRNTPVDRRTVLPCFTIDIDTIERRSGLSGSAVRSLFECLSVPSGEMNRDFYSIGDFNVANAAPLIPTGDGKTFLCST